MTNNLEELVAQLATSQYEDQLRHSAPPYQKVKESNKAL